jgi:multidrug resistance efflux pump
MEDFRRARLPLVVWLAAASMAAALLTGRARGREYIGLASAMRYTVSSPVAGRVEAVLVRELDEVRKGQIVARLEDEMLQARIQTAVTTTKQLTAELEAEQARLTAGRGPLAEAYSSDLRRFRMDEQGRRLSVLSLRVEVENDQIEYERLRLDADRAAQLYERGILSEAERELARLAAKQVAARLESNKELLATTEAEVREATRRREDFERAHPSAAQVRPALAPLEEAIHVQEGILQELRAEQANLVLRAPVSGAVTQVLCRKGQAVGPAEPILVVSEDTPTEILAYLPESAAGRVHEQTIVEITRRADPSRVAESVVTRVGASFELKPLQLWRDPRVPEHGLPVAIAAVPALRLTPGEVVFVRTK